MAAALSREFGVAWMARADGVGNEFADVTDAEIDAFSSRRDSVAALQAEVAGPPVPRQIRPRAGSARIAEYSSDGPGSDTGV